MFRTIFAAILVFAAPPALAAAGDCFADLAATHNYTNGFAADPTPAPDGKSVLYLRSGPRDTVQRLYEFDLASHRERELIAPETLLGGQQEKLSAEEKARRERRRIEVHGFVSYELSRDGKRVLLSLGGKLYVLERASGKVTALPGTDWLSPKFSPDATRVAALNNDELHVIDITSATDTQLTRGAGPTLTHGEAEFVAQEEMDRSDGFWWSPDSKSLAYEEADLSPVEVHYIADPLHPDAAPVAFRYPRAGTANAKVRLGIISAAGGATTWVAWDNAAYPYLVRLSWRDGPLTLVVENRALTEERILAADALGATRPLWTERDAAWLELPPPVFPKWLPDRSGFLWASERNGQWQLERHDAGGKLLNAITPKDFRFDTLIDVDTKTRTAVIEGSRDRETRDIWRVKLTGGEPTALSHARGLHQASFGEQHAIYADEFDNQDGSAGVAIFDAAGKTIATPPSRAEKPRFVPSVEYMTVGARGFDALVMRPRDFDAKRHYPVILAEYTGPTSKEVQASARKSLDRQCMADEGFIVVSLDNRGTPDRGHDWLRVIKGDFIDTALNDQVEGLRAIAARVPQMDLSRAGVVGWSFGGYFAAMATMRRPDVFAAGVAGAPVVDWQDYDTYYTERYIQTPQTNPSGYRRSSVLSYADQLKRPLLVVHGVTDDNVYFQNTMQLIMALLKAGKPYQLLLLPGTHMLADPAIRARESERVMEFFQKNLAAGK